MPRRPGQEMKGKGPFAELKAGLGLDDRPSSYSSSGSGYEVENVCVPCLGMLQGTPLLLVGGVKADEDSDLCTCSIITELASKAPKGIFGSV